jgi:predicted nucleic acid-binding protein
MTAEGVSSLFVDTGALYARFVSNDQHHDEAREVFGGIRDGELAYRPLFTTRYVLTEVTRLLLYNAGHDEAQTALNAVNESNVFVVLSDTDEGFESACRRFAEYDDQDISLVDHLTAVMAERRDVKQVFTFDSDFRTLGFDVVPEDMTSSHD